jgi:hypothetical protein
VVGAASAAYLTVSEIFPMEERLAGRGHRAAAVGPGGRAPKHRAPRQAPSKPSQIFIGYIVAAVVMIVGGIIGERSKRPPACSVPQHERGDAAHHRDRHPGADGPPAVVSVALDGSRTGRIAALVAFGANASHVAF